jgi:hypothetical protein
MAMGRGRKFRIMARCGAQMSPRAGLLIATVAGSMSLIGDGPGFLMIPGAGPLITMAAGCTSMAVGDGGRVRLMGIRSIVRYGLRLMCRSSALGLDSELDSDLDLASDRLAGYHSGQATSFTPGGDDGAEATGLRGLASSTVADLPRCERVRGSRT